MFFSIFDKEKDSDAYYPTVMGGLVSLFVYLAMGAFLVVQYLKIKAGAFETYSIVK
jgi:phosphate starvation-inducible membrane PsiE